MNETRPAFVTEDHLAFLDRLRESGRTNMFGAAPYLRRTFRDLSEDQAGECLVYWMESYGERHAENRAP